MSKNLLSSISISRAVSQLAVTPSTNCPSAYWITLQLRIIHCPSSLHTQSTGPWKMSFAHFCARLSWVAQKGRRHGKRGCHAVKESPPNIGLTFQSTRGRKVRRRALVRRYLRKRLVRIRARVARRGPRFCTWDTLFEHWSLVQNGGPSHGSRERGHRQGRPKAACPPGWGHWTGHGCSVACWERPGCWVPQGTEAGLHWAPAAKPPGASEWGCGKGRRLCARVTWLHTGQPESHPGVRYSHSPPEQKTNNAMHSLQVFCTSIFQNICPMLCCGISGGLRRRNTLDKWPVHHRARTHSYSHSHLQTIHSVQFIFPACLWIEEETGARRGNSRQPEEKKQTQKKKKKKISWLFQAL